MGLFSRMAGRSERRVRTEPKLAPEQRAAFQGGWDALAAMSAAGRGSSAGQVVNSNTVENLGTVMACVNAVASAMSTLPPYVYRMNGGDGRTEAPNHPVSRLTRQPNDNQTWPDWVEWTIAQALLHGNALSAIEADGAGRPMALRPLAWPHVNPVMLPSGRLAYDYGDGRAPRRRYLDSEVFHLRDRSDDGLIGRSRLSRAPDVLGNGLALQEWASSIWRNHAAPSGMYSVDGNLDEAKYNRLKAYVEERYIGIRNAGRPMIGDMGAKWYPFSSSPEDAEVLASRRFSVEELARLYQVPPPIVQDYTNNTFTNAAQASLWFAQLTLTPWARKIEAEFSRSVFGASSAYELVIDLSGLMRGDFVARWQAWQIAVSSKILDPNEVREAEGYSPRAAEPAPSPAPTPTVTLP